jgi:D-alanyl-lipoteichoic acid acyltransferase DltB (MBOAT superfamily)
MKIWNYENVTNGLTLMVWGLFVKMVIADRVAILVNTVFDGVYLYGTVALVAGALGFALQIYCDFMGYSTIAIGAAKVMGFTLMENFDTPYFATSISDFWRRWHISLSTWFRDYVYIPLGGNRCSKIRKYFNLMVTFGVSGLWHGANWTYVFWGFLHGIYQVVGDITKPFRQKLWKKTNARTESFSFKLAQVAGTFVLVDIAWIFFRADSLGIAVNYCKRMFTKWDPWSLFNGEIYNLGLDRFEFNILIVASVTLLLVDLLRYCKKQLITDFLQEQCIWFRWGVIFALIFATIIYGMYGIQFESSQFIYFQF